ncbi:dihydrofolate reductase family protein [Nonomuraea rhodomycinica]|uniref:Dihydrofolate reductase family protein n=1 Tax=Nonomuraea rhodomycinica TaxID=1712872 RepID=A0A7Y6IM23_9ACTN|nr:dihydrofolate reductase family protein [Nonomuraea rhodomycinica]NUW39414.1 dihydrofolate reductase family protein [Nonomuraea rhodomycinica]
MSRTRGSTSGRGPASRTLTDVSAWASSKVVDGDLLDAVGREERDVIVAGSRSVVHALMTEDLVDEYRLLAFPVILGAGERLFPGGRPPAYLEGGGGPPADHQVTGSDSTP